ncbi:hypothetical protein KX816_11580 [Sphingosinicellaceae bacterium]|nr:hypothetical protein KX816_11580 [Sphingosinicellaceae bacterium]
MTFRPAFLAVLLVAGAPAFGQGMSTYDDRRAGYVQRDDREIGSVFEFEAPLARFGSWVPSRYGRAWHPRVSPDWRPYTVGRWVDGPDGQTWESDEPWGWATYHYGRWGFDDRWGWVWVPDTEWAPAWVAWRDGDDYSGWAPLPPRSGYGYDVDAWDYSQWYAPSWIYVPRGALYRRNVGSVALPWRSGRSYWNVTRGSYRDRDASRSYGGQRRQGGLDGGRPNWHGGPPPGRVRPGRPPEAGVSPGRVAPQDRRPQGRPEGLDRPGRDQADRPQDARPGRDRPSGDWQATPRPDRRPGYVPFGSDPGQPQPGAGQGRNRPGANAGNNGGPGNNGGAGNTGGRGGRGGAAVAPGGAPAPVATPRPRPAPPPAAAPLPPQQARPAPPPGSPARQPRANPRMGREELRKPD